MRTGKSYKTTLINKSEPVKFTVKARIAYGEVFTSGSGCGNPDCTDCSTKIVSDEHRKVEVAFTQKDTLILRRLNYTQNRLETHQVFESVPHLQANLNSSLTEEAAVIEQLSAFDPSNPTADLFLAFREKQVAEAQAKAEALEASTAEI